MNASKQDRQPSPLPDFYQTVALDIIDFTGKHNGVWMDVGCGTGELSLAVAALHQGTVIIFDPNREALAEASRRAREVDGNDRVIPISGVAEAIPLLAESVDVVISRGSFFFWDDRPAGLREIYRILRPGGKAMIGGGLGSRYPQWARQEFIRQKRDSFRRLSPEDREAFALARQPDTFRHLALEAELPAFEVIGEGGLDEDAPHAGMGIWLRFVKAETGARLYPRGGR